MGVGPHLALGPTLRKCFQDDSSTFKGGPNDTFGVWFFVFFNIRGISQKDGKGSGTFPLLQPLSRELLHLHGRRLSVSLQLELVFGD